MSSSDSAGPKIDRPDIVSRLRAVDHMSVEDCFLQSHLYAQAAGEIERLRAVMRVNGLFVGLSRAEMEKILYGR
jgi:hypothetical protein